MSSRYDDVRSHIKKQVAELKKIIQGHEKETELRKLADEQVWDEANKETLYPHYIEMPESNRSNWKHLDVQTRAIYVLRISRAFTDKEIGVMFGVSRRKVYRIYTRLSTSK